MAGAKGPGRAGAYTTYDWIVNLFGLNMHRADAIIPRYCISPSATPGISARKGPSCGWRLEPERALVLRSDDGNWVWAFILNRTDGATSLVSRNRIATPGAPWLARAVSRYLMEPGSLVIERKMLHGIRHRAQRLAIDNPAGAVGPAA